MNIANIPFRNSTPTSLNPDDPRQPRLSLNNIIVKGDFKHNYIADRVIPTDMFSSIGMYSSTGWITESCIDVNKNKKVMLGIYNQPFKTGVPTNWKQKGIFEASERMGFTADINQKKEFLISTKTY